MYTVIVEEDGRLEFELSRPPERLTAAQAREILRLLDPTVTALQRRASAEASGRKRASRTPSGRRGRPGGSADP